MSAAATAGSGPLTHMSAFIATLSVTVTQGAWRVRRDVASLYDNRRLIEDYPGLDAMSLDSFQTTLGSRPDELPRIQMILGYLDRLIDVRGRRNFLVVGCGPVPEPVRILRELGFNVLGVEPVPKFVAAARQYLGDEEAVTTGHAEALPSETEY